MAAQDVEAAVETDEGLEARALRDVWIARGFEQVAGCAEDQVGAVGGDGQGAPMNAPLPDSLAVRVTDAFGNPVARIIQMADTLQLTPDQRARLAPISAALQAKQDALSKPLVDAAAARMRSSPRASACSWVSPLRTAFQ